MRLLTERWFYVAAGVVFLALATWQLFGLHNWTAAFGDLAIAGVYFMFLGVRQIWIKNGFRRGYLQYQTDMLVRAAEAARRGIGPEAWLHAEVERTTGVTVIPYPEG